MRGQTCTVTGWTFIPGDQSHVHPSGHAPRIITADLYSHKQCPHTCNYAWIFHIVIKLQDPLSKQKRKVWLDEESREWEEKGNLGTGVSFALWFLKFFAQGDNWNSMEKSLKVRSEASRSLLSSDWLQARCTSSRRASHLRQRSAVSLLFFLLLPLLMQPSAWAPVSAPRHKSPI